MGIKHYRAQRDLEFVGVALARVVDPGLQAGPLTARMKPSTGDVNASHLGPGSQAGGLAHVTPTTLHRRGVSVCGTNGREASLGARGVWLGYGEGVEVALAVAL